MDQSNNIRLKLQADKIVQGLIPAFVPAAARRSLSPAWQLFPVSTDANCYAYGSNHLLNGRRNPGHVSKDEESQTFLKSDLINGIAQDGLIRINKEDISRGDEIAILALYGGDRYVRDYHWLNQNRHGKITHKVPGTPPTDKDWAGNIITSAETAFIGGYKVSGYFILSETGSEIDAPTANVKTLLQTGFVPAMDIEMQDGEIISVCRRDLEDLQDRFFRNAPFHAGFVDMTQHSLSGGQLYPNDWENGGKVRLLPGAAEQMQKTISRHVKRNYAAQFAL